MPSTTTTTTTTAATAAAAECTHSFTITASRLPAPHVVHVGRDQEAAAALRAFSCAGFAPKITKIVAAIASVAASGARTLLHSAGSKALCCSVTSRPDRRVVTPRSFLDHINHKNTNIGAARSSSTLPYGELGAAGKTQRI